jgi:hypothetical protein
MQRSDAAKEQAAIAERLKRKAVMVGGSHEHSNIGCSSAWNVMCFALHAKESCSQGAGRN